MAGKRAAKPSATPTKPVAKAKGQKYEYTELAKVSLTASDTHNVYGIIIDATFPHKVSADKYVCSLKIIDPTLHYKGGKASDNDWATVVIYAKRFEDLPICNKVGDIIRLHRATLRMYKNQRQFNVSTHWNGSWAVFNTEDSNYAPAFYSGKRATFEKHETTLLSTLRKWVVTYFSQQDGQPQEHSLALAQAKSQDRDFDVVAKVLSIFEMDEFTNELKLADKTGDCWYVLALKLKFPGLRAGQVVRIRSATYDETSSSKNVLNLQHYSNIMSFVSSSKLAKQLAAKVSDDQKADAAELAKAVPAHAIVLSEVDKKWANLQQNSLNDLFHHDGSLSGNTFRTTVSVVKVEGAVQDMCRVWNKAQKKASSAKGSKDSNLIWQVSLLCKDASTASNSNKYRVFVNSAEGLGAEFFGKAANLWDNAAAAKKVTAQVDKLCKFNTYVDAVVEKRNGQYLVKDTKLWC